MGSNGAHSTGRAPRLMWALALLGVAGLVGGTGCGKKQSDGNPSGAGGAAPAKAAQNKQADEAAKGGPQGAAAKQATAPKKTTAPHKAAEPAASAEPTKVVLWHAYRAAEKDAIEQVVKAFNASHPAIVVRAQAIPYDPFVDKVTITVPRGQGPDVFIFAHNMIGNWVEEGVLEPLSGKIDGASLKAFLPSSVKALVYRKNLYGLPLAFKSLVFYYNKALLPGGVPATMEELIPKLQALTTGDRHGLAYEAGLLYFHAPWIHAFGGRFFDDEHKPAFDTPEGAKALEFARSLHFKDKLLPKGLSGFMVTSLFNDGNAAVVMNGPWFRAEIKPQVDYGVAVIPTVQGGVAKPLLGIEAVFVSKTSKHKAAAIEFAQYLAGPASAKVRMDVGKQPVAHLATLEEGAKRDPAMRVFMDQSKQAVLMDASPEMQLVWSTMDSAVAKGIFAKDAKPSEELKKAQAKLLVDLAKRGK